jgi:hypothetical protein
MGMNKLWAFFSENTLHKNLEKKQEIYNKVYDLKEIHGLTKKEIVTVFFCSKNFLTSKKKKRLPRGKKINGYVYQA